MKKLMVFALAMVLVLSSLSAFAAVPSKTTWDMVQVGAIVSANGVAVSPDFVLAIAEDKEEVVAELAKIFDFVVNQGGSAMSYFGEEVALSVAAMLPEGTDLSTLELNEFVTFAMESYDPAYGDMIVTFNFVTEYAEGQVLIAMLGLYSGEVDEEGNNIVEWVALEAVAQADGSVVITFPTDILIRLQDAPAAALAILSEPAEEPVDDN